MTARRRPTRILVNGYFGFGNTGDEAILEATLTELREREPVEVTVVSGAPGATEIEHDVAAVHWQDIAAIADAAERADLMVLGGGGLLQDYWPPDPDAILTRAHGSLTNWAGFALLARATGTPLVAHGLGIGPLRTAEARELAGLTLRQAAQVTVRDATSAALAHDLGVPADRVTVVADPAFLLEPEDASLADIFGPDEPPPTGRPLVAVSVRPWTFDDHPLATRLAAALDRLVEERGAAVLFVPFHRSTDPTEDDAGAAADVRARMIHADRARILRADPGTRGTATVLAAADLVVGMRLHAIVLAAAGRTPTVAIAYDPKVRLAMERLGAADRVLGLDATTDALTDLLEGTLDRGDELAAALDATVPDLVASARRGIDLLAETVRRPPPPPALDAATEAALGRLLVHLAADRHRLESDLDRAREEVEHARAAFDEATWQRRLDELQAAHDTLLAQRNEMWESRAFKLARTYWRLRDLPDTARQVAPWIASRLPLPGSTKERLRAARRQERLRDVDAERRSAEERAELRGRLRGELDRVLAETDRRRGIVVFPPSIGWDVALFQRPQQMALAFARLGYLVLYGLGPHNAEKVTGFRHVRDGVYLMHVPEDVEELLADIPDPLAVAYTYNFAWTDKLRDPVRVYEYIDHLDVFTTSYGIGELTRWHADAVERADLVVGSARDLYDELRTQRPDALLVPNGVDYAHFAAYRPSRPEDMPEDIADLVRDGVPIVGYYGAMAEWLDYDLIAHAARAMPDAAFVFIGPDYHGELASTGILDLPNVRWLGTRPYDSLPAYLYRFDVATIPFVVDEVTHRVSPLKLFEYMAGGRPVVVPDLRELARYPELLVAKDRDDWVAKLRRGLELRHDPDHLRRLRRAARRNTWDQRAGLLADAADLVRARRRTASTG